MSSSPTSRSARSLQARPSRSTTLTARTVIGSALTASTALDAQPPDAKPLTKASDAQPLRRRHQDWRRMFAATTEAAGDEAESR